jgi:hypothetical protein
VVVFFLLLSFVMLRRAFNLDDVAADFRPTPKLRPSPYQLTDLKLDKRREVSRIKVPSRFGRLEDVPVPCCLSIQAVGSKRIAVRKLTTAAGPMGRKAEAERVERLDLARTLVGLARAVAKHSLVLSALEGVEVEDIAFLFGDRAPGTLRNHLSVGVGGRAIVRAVPWMLAPLQPRNYLIFS